MQEPGIIRKLDEVVVNRIAAGEIIQRPANALKELLENSLDAKSSWIQVTVKSGGLKLLQIQDNGTGIRKEDMEIVCERFTTSKLCKFEDLSEIATYGFRGEALASISHVAHLTIQTKTAQERCGYKASYEDGRLTAPPKPCASNQGTIISIEDLFYNMPARRQGLKSAAEEHQKISDVISKYAVHNVQVGISLKKHGEQPSIKTSHLNTRTENIRLIYGAQIANELLDFALSDDVHKFKAKGYVTKVNYSNKKGIMLLFINHRLVESTALKTAIDAIYATYLPKGMHPFVYMDLQLLPQNLDVNVHPTKHEVHFLYQDDIIEKIKLHIESSLLGSNSTRTFYKQLRLPGVSAETEATSKSADESRVYDKDLVRTDAKMQKLDKFFELGALTQSNSGLSTSSADTPNTTTSTCGADESFRITAEKLTKTVRLTSVLKMQKRVEQGCDVLLRGIMKEMVFVGVADVTLALFQHETKLYLCNTRKFCEELFYQRLVFGFQNCAEISVNPPLSIKELVLLALDTDDSGWTPEDGDKAELAENAAAILQEKAAIMREYFALRITDDGELASLPQLLPQYMPCSIFLPLYMLRLATEVEWEDEVACFETFCRETAKFYAQFSTEAVQANEKQHAWLVEHVMYAAFKRYLLPPGNLKNHLYELTNLPTLYKVFERC